MFRRIGTNSLTGVVVRPENLRPTNAIARYLQVTGADMVPQVSPDGKAARTARFDFPATNAQRNPTMSFGRVYYIQYHPRIGRPPQLVECMEGTNLFTDFEPVTESQIAYEYVVRVYELQPETKL